MEGIVLRLSAEERETLKMLKAALTVSEYTDDVDNIRSYRREDTMAKAMHELFSAVCGLALVGGSLGPEAKAQLKKGNATLATLEPTLRSAFEIGRRFKRLNPNQLRGDYGKLMMLMQDAASPSRRRSLGLSGDLVAPVHTVGQALRSIECEELLNTPQWKTAASPLPPRPAPELVQQKENALKELIATANGDERKGEIIERCARSVDDAAAFIKMCRAPILKLMIWLDKYFKEGDTSATDLTIRSGSGGACFSHDHRTQHMFVKCSLTLWDIVHRDIFEFWEAVEQDMLSSEGRYSFANTGQGFHRVCGAPNTAHRMSKALAEARQRMGGWVGLSVVHLGDNDVPNALVFIDKYTVIPKMLAPIVAAIEGIDAIFDEATEEEHPGIRNLLRSMYGTPDKIKMMILRDFFRHGFDGSGDDGGSCIDGRLTSAWNWCSLLHKKEYYDAFVLTGFTGFDAC